jgi:hypothetical protein
MFAGVWNTAQDGMNGNGGGFEQDCLLIAHTRGNAKELSLGKQHFFAPTTANRLWTGKASLFAQAVIADSA